MMAREPEQKPTHSSTTASPPDEPKKDKKATLVVRLLADYWDKEGTRHSAAYVDEHGEKHLTGALLELPAEEARQLVKTSAAERGDEY
jgi:hypothetical protein